MNKEFNYVSTLPINRTTRDQELARFFGNQLKEFRYLNKISRTVLAYKTGFSDGAIRHYEKGRRLPGYRFLCELQRAFGVSIDAFIPQGEMDRL